MFQIFTFKKSLDGVRSGKGLRKQHGISQEKITLDMFSIRLSVYWILQF